MTYFTNIQRDNAREELIAAFEGYMPRHGDQYASHGIYAIDNETRKLQIATLEALGLDADHLKQRQKVAPDAAPVTRATQKIRGAGKDLVTDIVFEQSRLLRAVEGVNPVTKAWCAAIYFTQDSSNLFRLLHDIYAKNYKIRKGTEQKVKMLITLVIKQSIAISLDRQKITGAVVGRLMGVSDGSYRESWKHKFESMVELLTDLDEVFLDLCCLELEYPVYQSSIKTSKTKRFALIVS